MTINAIDLIGAITNGCLLTIDRSGLEMQPGKFSETALWEHSHYENRGP